MSVVRHWNGVVVDSPIPAVFKARLEKALRNLDYGTRKVSLLRGREIGTRWSLRSVSTLNTC